MAKFIVNESGELSAVNPNTGKQVWVPQSGIDEALGAGFVPETDEQATKREFAEKYDNPLYAAGLGALSGATAGLGTTALVKSGALSPEAATAIQEESPYAYGAGGLAGIVGSIGAGTGLPALLGRGAARAGAGVAAGLGGQAAARAAGGATAAALEGAAYGAGLEAERRAFSGKDLVSADALGDYAKSAGAGSVLGLGMSLGTSAAIAGAKGAGKLAQKALDRQGLKKLSDLKATQGAAEASSAALAGDIDAATAALQKAEQAAAKTGGEVEAIAREYDALLPRPAVAPGVEAGAYAQEVAEAARLDPLKTLKDIQKREQGFEAAVAKGDISKKADILDTRIARLENELESAAAVRSKADVAKLGDELSGVKKQMDANQKGRKTLADRIASGTNVAENERKLAKLQGIWKNLDDKQKRLRPVLKDATAADEAVSVMGKRSRADVAKELNIARKTRDSLDNQLASSQSRLAMSAEDLAAYRSSIGLAEGETATQRLARMSVLKDAQKKAGEAAAQSQRSLSTAERQLQALRSTRKKVLTAGEAAADQISREHGNWLHSASRVVSNLAGKSSGILGSRFGTGVLIGGGGVGGLLAGMVMPRAAAGLAAGLNKMAKSPGLKSGWNSLAKVTGERIVPATRMAAVLGLSKAMSGDDYGTMKNEIDSFRPDAVLAGVDHAVSLGADPMLASEIAQKHAAAMEYLKREFPRSSAPGGEVSGKPYKPDRLEAENFAHKYNAINNPTSYIDNIMAGDMRAVRAQTKAWREVFPEEHRQLSARMLEAADRMQRENKKIPRKIAEMMAEVTGEQRFLPVSRTAAFSARLREAQQAEQWGKKPRKPADFGKEQLTSTQRLMA